MKKTALISMLTAIAMCIFILEAQIPPIVPIPGVKAGFSNVIVMVTIMLMGRREAAYVLFIRIILSAILSGAGIGVVYSLSGGLTAYTVMCLLAKPLREYIWVLSTLGAIAHNIGQIAAAVVVMKTTAVISYLPILLISGIISGCFSGIIAQTLILKNGYVKRLFENVKKENQR